MKKNGSFVLAGVFGVIFALLLIGAKGVDVSVIGPANTSVGCSTVNAFVCDRVPVNDTMVLLSDLLFYASFAWVGVFAVIGLCQWIKRKSLKKVDTELYALACFYGVMAGVYVFFEKVIINYRPVLEDGNTFPEASFPSSHAMLAIALYVSAAVLLGKYIKDKKICNIVRIVLTLLAVLTVIFRMFSGMHWFTDILAGVSISLCLVFLYQGICLRLNKEK